MRTTTLPPCHDLLIVGAGPVGLTLALALRDSGLDIVLVDARSPAAAAADPRDLALAHGSRLTLESLGLWSQLNSTAIEHIHISQQGGFGRTRIDAAEHGVAALGHVVAAGELASKLRAAVDAAGIRVIDHTEVSALEPGNDAICARLRNAEGEQLLRARLAACAEGGLQQADAAAVCTRDYQQHALIAHLDVAGGHRHTAYERFTANGPLALLPRGQGFTLVHVVHPDAVPGLRALDDASYLAQLQQIIGGRVRLQAVSARSSFPLQLRYRRQPVGARTVWLGNAAQTLHPVAGQGFNLALRDVWALRETLLEGLRSQHHRQHGPAFDAGAPALLQAYLRQRQCDRQLTIRFTDSLVRIFSNDNPLLHHARGAALGALDLLPPVRNFIARRMLFGARAWP